MARRDGLRLTRSNRRPRGRSASCRPIPVAALIAVALTWRLASIAAADSIPTLTCGTTARGQLAADGKATYKFEAAPGQRIAIEALDLSASNELIRVRVSGPGVASNTCIGRIQPPMRAAAQLMPGATYQVEVSSCYRTTPVDYALTLQTVSAVAQNCGNHLPCRDTIDAEFERPGEVDAYRFEGTVGETVLLEASEESESFEGVELRIFDPDGAPLDTTRPGGSGCAESRSFVLPRTGTYTVLANPCYGIGSGAYRVGWYPRSCPAMTQIGKLNTGAAIGLRFAADGSTVVEITSGELSCGFADSASFVWQPNPALAIDDARFAGASLEVPARSMLVDFDGTLLDADDDGRFDQSLGGLSFAKAGGRCNFTWHATALPDRDGDGWADVFEERYGSDPASEVSTPEGASVPITVLSRPNTCHDSLDNDLDGDADGSDAGCQQASGDSLSGPLVFAGKHSDGEPLWIRLSDDRVEVGHVATAGIRCGAVDTSSRGFDVHLALRNGRFSGRGMALADDATWDIDGVLFDADGDSIADEVIGGITVTDGETECHLKWWATSQVDSDSDGWSDSAELWLGSDPQPMPGGLGADSTPENRAVPTTALFGADACNDGVDNDDDDRVDSEDAPACAASTPTPTASRSVTATVTPSRTATAPSTPTRTTTSTPVATTPTATLAPTRTSISTPAPTQTAPPATATPTRGPTCVGDCDGNGAVTVDEVQKGVGVVLGSVRLDTCPPLDANGDGEVTVDEILVALNNALGGCHR